MEIESQLWIVAKEAKGLNTDAGEISIQNNESTHYLVLFERLNYERDLANIPIVLWHYPTFKKVKDWW